VYCCFFFFFEYALLLLRGFFLIAKNDCTPAYPPQLGFVCGLLRRVGGGAVLNKAYGNPKKNIHNNGTKLLILRILNPIYSHKNQLKMPKKQRVK
jgi:hypothetical protein